MSNAIDRALFLAEQGERDPVRAVQNAENIRALLGRAKAELGAMSAAPPASSQNHCSHHGEATALLSRFTELAEMRDRPLAQIAATRIVRVDGVPSIQPGKETTALKVEWPGGDGVVRALFAGTLDGDPANLSRISVRISINGTTDLFTDGQAPVFVPIVAFHARDHAWFRLRDYPVSPAQKWSIYFSYESDVTTLPPITPFLLFAYAEGKRELHGI